MIATEKRLIDAKEGKKRFCAIAQPAEYNGVIHLVVPISEIDKLPTVEAVEVVHGRWKYYHKQNIAVCTNCSFERDLDANFGKAVSCPNCGAKMDGDGNG